MIRTRINESNEDQNKDDENKDDQNENKDKIKIRTIRTRTIISLINLKKTRINNQNFLRSRLKIY